MEWIRLDPAREWLADVSCAQTELMLANQLQHSKDVHSQVHEVPDRKSWGEWAPTMPGRHPCIEQAYAQHIVVHIPTVLISATASPGPSA